MILPGFGWSKFYHSTLEDTIKCYILNTTLCDKFCLLLAAGRWFISTNKTDRPDISGVKHNNPLNKCISIKSRGVQRFKFYGSKPLSLRNDVGVLVVSKWRKPLCITGRTQVIILNFIYNINLELYTLY